MITILGRYNQNVVFETREDLDHAMKWRVIRTCLYAATAILIVGLLLSKVSPPAVWKTCFGATFVLYLAAQVNNLMWARRQDEKFRRAHDGD